MVNFLIPESAALSVREQRNEMKSRQTCTNAVQWVWVNNDIELAARMQIHVFFADLLHAKNVCALCLLLLKISSNLKLKYENCRASGAPVHSQLFSPLLFSSMRRLVFQCESLLLSNCFWIIDGIVCIVWESDENSILKIDLNNLLACMDHAQHGSRSQCAPRP